MTVTQEPTSEPCGCGWLTDDDPTLLHIHDSFLAMDGPKGLRDLAEALRALMDDYAGITEPLECLTGQHNFQDPVGAYALAQVLDYMFEGYRGLRWLEEYAQDGKSRWLAIENNPNLRKVAETFRSEGRRSQVAS